MNYVKRNQTMAQYLKGKGTQSITVNTNQYFQRKLSGGGEGRSERRLQQETGSVIALNFGKEIKTTQNQTQSCGERPSRSAMSERADQIKQAQRIRQINRQNLLSGFQFLVCISLLSWFAIFNIFIFYTSNNIQTQRILKS